MNKADLIDLIAAEACIPQSRALRVCNALTGAIADTLRGGGTVKVAGFGTFRVTARVERVGRNPRTGAAMRIAGHKTAVFSPSRELKQSLN